MQILNQLGIQQKIRWVKISSTSLIESKLETLPSGLPVWHLELDLCQVSADLGWWAAFTLLIGAAAFPRGGEKKDLPEGATEVSEGLEGARRVAAT